MTCLPFPWNSACSYDSQEDLFFVNFEGYAIKYEADVQEVEAAVEQILAAARPARSTPSSTTTISPSPRTLVDDYTDMVKGLMDRFYSGVTRYTTSTFLRMKIGDALKERNVAPHIYRTDAEAKRALEGLR